MRKKDIMLIKFGNVVTMWNLASKPTSERWITLWISVQVMHAHVSVIFGKQYTKCILCKASANQC